MTERAFVASALVVLAIPCILVVADKACGMHWAMWVLFGMVALGGERFAHHLAHGK